MAGSHRETRDGLELTRMMTRITVGLRFIKVGGTLKWSDEQRTED